MKPGRCGIAAHYHKRHGTTDPGFAAPNLLDGTVVGRCIQCHRREEFICFLDAANCPAPANKAIADLRRPQASEGAGLAEAARAMDSGPQLHISSNASSRVFVGSAIKTFMLAQALTQADTLDVVATISGHQLTLDQSVWSADSAMFNPPNLTGTVTERTTLEAMIIHSDNTATDTALKSVGPGVVRNFITSIGQRSTAIPDSTGTFLVISSMHRTIRSLPGLNYRRRRPRRLSIRRSTMSKRSLH
jgi:beta-lactamase class A